MNVIHCSKEGGHYLFYLTAIAKLYQEPLCWCLTSNYLEEIKVFREDCNDIYVLCDNELWLRNAPVSRVIRLENSIKYVFSKSEYPSRYIAYNFGEKWFEKLLYELLYLYIKLRPNTEKLFLLGDQKLFINSRKQKCLPDPVPLGRTKPSVYKSKRPFTVLLIGSISIRKGVKYILDVAKILNEDNRYLFRVVGRFSKDCVHLLRESANYTNVVIENRWLTQEDFHTEVEKSDILILPYKRLNTSSGILGYACLYRKPVITFNKLAHIPRIVKEYSLGSLISDGLTNVKEDFDDVLKNYESIVEEMMCELYLKENSPDLFVDLLLGE